MIEPEDVVRHLGKQEKHWKAGRSAHALTNLWHSSNGLPKSVLAVFRKNSIFKSAILIDAFLERQVDLKTPGRNSQTDLLAVVGLQDRIAIMAVEGKAGEPFGEFVSRWLGAGEDNKKKRLVGLCKTLGILPSEAGPIRYQLLHRTASAIYEAQRYKTDLAIMLVQSFASDEKSFSDYRDFLKLMGVTDKIYPDELYGPIVCENVSLYLSWIHEETCAIKNEKTGLKDLRTYAERLGVWCARVQDWCKRRAAE